MKIIDCVSYNGEKELFEIRYNILKDFVDEFIVVEFDKTFSGKDKQPYFMSDFKNLDKVSWTVFTENHYNQYKELAESSPNTKGAAHWKMEFMQKESIKDALTHLKDDDVVYVGDCDEIWQGRPIYAWNYPVKLKLRVYTYYLNNLSNEQFWGTMVINYGGLKKLESLNYARTTNLKTQDYYGWHFTSMHHQLAKKLTDSYTEEDYAHPRVLDELQSNIENNRDFLGRDFTYKVDESQWPDYLKNHRQNYKHLLK